MTIPLSDQIACVRREIRMREQCYPRWITAGRMSRDKAEAELNTMRAVLRTLENQLQPLKPAA